MAVLAFKKDAKGTPIPDPTKTKILYDRNKIKVLLDSILPPLFDHVSLARRPLPARDLTPLNQLFKEIEYLDPAKIKASGLSEQRLIDISASIERHVQAEVVSAYSLSPFNPYIHSLTRMFLCCRTSSVMFLLAPGSHHCHRSLPNSWSLMSSGGSIANSGDTFPTSRTEHSVFCVIVIG